ATSFQVARLTRLCLAHQRHQATKRDKGERETTLVFRVCDEHLADDQRRQGKILRVFVALCEKKR
ncbi:MAG: hypothetical protein LGR52_03250, partial [Candidatus Thiosymbion ectosymbiont of Robbea hypermnestra]|nr:hypothetical protein [Candidatus Thiosymbion ectosymbiont of Robbea hypermnestra]